MKRWMWFVAGWAASAAASRWAMRVLPEENWQRFIRLKELDRQGFTKIDQWEVFKKKQTFDDIMRDFGAATGMKREQ